MSSTATAVTVRRIALADLRQQGEALFRDHYDEVALNKRVMQLAPDWTRYEALDEAGILHILGAFAGDALVGYSVNFITTHLHYRELVHLQNDVLFVTGEHRGGVGKRLIYATEQLAVAEGCKLVLWHAKPGTDLNGLLEKLHYGVQDIIWSKEV